MSEEVKPADSNKEAADVDCKSRVSKCLSSGAKSAEEVEKALSCLRDAGP